MPRGKKKQQDEDEALVEEILGAEGVVDDEELVDEEEELEEQDPGEELPPPVEMPKRTLNKRGRAPHEPTQDRKRRTARGRKSVVTQPPVGSNPRAAMPGTRDFAAAQLGRRREQIWRQRQAEGQQVRRPIYDKNGNDTGASTSSLR